MAQNQLLSPGVLDREFDATTVIPAVSTNDGAIAGVFRWGPVNVRTQVDSENQLVKLHGKPNNSNYKTFFSAGSFLAYADSLWVVRAANTTGISPDFDAVVTANSDTVVLTGDGSSVNVVSLGLEEGIYLMASTTNNVSLTVDAQINEIVNSTAFTISTSSDVSVETGSNTITVAANVDTSANGTTQVELETGNTDDMAVGYVFTGSSNDAVVNSSVSAEVVSITNSTAFVVNVDIIEANGTSTLTFTKAGTCSLQFVSNTIFNAVANTGRVANLEYAIITNEDAYDAKDGNFDTDVKFIARWPGELGNSLRVSVCGNSSGYSSNLDFTDYASRTSMQVNVNSNTTVLRVMAPNTAAAAANTAAVKALLQVTDNIEVGNTLMGTQFMKITAIGNTVSVGADAVETLDVTTNSETTLASTTDTSNLVAGMAVSAAANNTMVDLVVNNVTNSTHFNFTSAPSKNLTTSSVTFAPTSYFTLQFEDPFVLSEDFKFASTLGQTNVLHRTWEFFNFVDQAPGQSDYQYTFGNSAINSDEVHVVVVDDGGKFTGIPGTVLETYQNVSRATDGKSRDGELNFWRTVINEGSQYVWAPNALSGLGENTAENLTDSTHDALSYPFNYGKDGADEDNIGFSLLANAWDKFKSKEDIDISLLISGNPRSYLLANYLIDNILEFRQDCLGFVSPQYSDVVNNPENEAAACVNFRNLLRSTSYAAMDCNWKYMYDRYNDTYRWVPMNGDMAGLCARTDDTNDPWWPPAGLNRGQLKNVVKLAWNPRQTARDTLYKNAVNPVVSFVGEGTVLWGDKTLLSKPSAFTRINVRRLFIVMRKAISRSARYFLFEFNDSFTRAQFKNMVNPYLADIKGRRGLYDFLVICDETNNTPTVIDSNEFIADIYVKPARSINFIYLNFIATPTGADFAEVIGNFG